MLKKFVPLNSNATPSKNPYEVRTFIGDMSKPNEWKFDPECGEDRRCFRPQNSTIAKVLTIEDEIRLIHQKTKLSRLQREQKKKCLETDMFLACVIPQRTPKELKKHAVYRERYLKTKQEIGVRVHDAAKPKVPLGKTPSLVQLPSPIEIGGGHSEEEEASEEEEGGEEEEEGKKPVKPRLATPTCSAEAVYLPPQRLLALKRPRSGMYHNETEPPTVLEGDMPFDGYNPRVLQEQLEEQALLKHDLITGKTGGDMWTWNIGLQKRASDLDRAYIEATIPKLDCNKMEPTLYRIPGDLEQTFTAEIVFGSQVVRPDPPPKKPTYFNRPKEIACIFVAYVESFRLNPDFWTAESMGNIIAAADKLYNKSISFNYKSPDMDFDIIPMISDRHSTVGLKAHFTGPISNEPNIYKSLSLYFSKYNAAVLCTEQLFLLIWKRCEKSFYVFDPNGRNEECERDFENGMCALMTTKYVEHLVHLIVSRSKTNPECDFHLYEIYLINFGKIPQLYPTKPFPKMTRKLWAVVNATYAIIPGANNGIQQPLSGNEPNASMVIAIFALLYGDIELPCLWRMEVVDELITFGKAYYKTLSKKFKLKRNQQLNIIDLPEKVMMGVYKAYFEKRPFLFTGHVADCKSFTDSQLIIAIKDLFSSNCWSAALVQIDNSIIAVWRDMEFFYVFDPFRRGKAGQVLDPEDYLTKGVACLQLHTNFESFCRILYRKALMMRRGGKFFVHGINVGCIKPEASVTYRKNRYGNLRLAYPTFTDEPPPKPKKTKKGKHSKLDRRNSIQSVPEEDRIPEFDDIDVVDGVLEEVLCEILQKMIEPTPVRPPVYKQVDKVLLRSDKTYLESRKYRIKHDQDFESVYETLRGYPEPIKQPMCLNDEIKIPSNFEVLPDGTWVIFGTSQLPVVDEEMTKLSGLLSGLVTAALTAKYKISTWNSELVEHAVEAVNSFGEQYHDYEQTLAKLLEKKVPKICIGKNLFYLKVQRITRSAVTRTLRQVLLDCLFNYNRCMVICQRFSCLIMKRYNFLYMFIGFACDTVGYRQFGPGPACLLRFVELDSLIRRIEFGCNPQGCEIVNYVILTLKVQDISEVPPERYRNWPNSEEEALYQNELARHQMLEQRKMDKIRYLDDELRKENDRILKFSMEKEKRREARKGGKPKQPPKKKRMSFLTEEEFYGEEGEVEEEEMESEGIQLKHKPGKKLKRELVDRFKPKPILYGYRMREKDCLFKIQGSKAMEGRPEVSAATIKPCFFASILAVLYAILRPLNQWNSQRVDRVIEGANSIANRVSNMATAYDRVIKNVIVDDYEFDVWTKTYEPSGVWGAPIDARIVKATKTRHYLLLQISNCTFAIYRDEYYHLFDAYGSMELGQDPEEEETEEESEDEDKSKKKCPKTVRRFGERNTASWILFADIESMLKYVNKRAASPNWKAYGAHKFHIVDVISYKKAAARTRILQLLTDMSVPMECKVSQYGEDESTICSHNESLGWLDMENSVPVWSRKNRRNTAGRYRNLPVTKLKKFDIEIDGRLWSIWGNLHPMAPVFDENSRGRQYLACNVIACCAATVYRLTDWSSQLLDTIVISGDKYHRDSLAKIKEKDYEFSLEDLDVECSLENIKFEVHLEHVAFGNLYANPSSSQMNLAEALMYFFGRFQFGILQCCKRYIGFGFMPGYDGGYFLFDCQSREHPLFPKGQGASYLLRTKHLQVLLYCMVVTMNIRRHNVQFTLHKVLTLREGALCEPSDEELEEEASDYTA